MQTNGRPVGLSNQRPGMLSRGGQAESKFVVRASPSPSHKNVPFISSLDKQHALDEGEGESVVVGVGIKTRWVGCGGGGGGANLSIRDRLGACVCC